MTTENERLGEILKAAREAAGIKQAAFAVLSSFSKSYICNLEQGRKEINPWIIAAYERVIGTGGLLAAGMEGDDMRRRAVLAALGTVASLGITDHHLITEALRMSLTESFDGDDWLEVAHVHGQRFMTSTAKQSQTSLTQHLLVLSREIRQTDSQTVRLATARLMTLHGMATANLGDTRSAAGWYRSARVAADRTDDQTLQRWVRGREAFRRGYEGASPDEVLRLAIDVDDVEAHLASAQAFGRLGLTTEATTAVDRAFRCYEGSDQSEGTIYAVQPWRFALSIAYVYALLGDIARSETMISQVQPPAGMVRWKAQLDMHRAVLMAKTGEPEAALAAARTVMDDHPVEQRSVLITHMWGEVNRAA